MSVTEFGSYTGLEGITNVFKWWIAPTDRIEPKSPQARRGPKYTKQDLSVLAMMTDAEKLERRRAFAMARTAEILRTNIRQCFIDPNPQQSADKTARIVGKHNRARSQ